MGYWFTASSGAIDAEKELLQCLARDQEAWAMLVAHFAILRQEPRETLKRESIASNRELGFFHSKDEAMVYRLTGKPPSPQIVVVGNAKGLVAQGLLIQEAQRRIAL